MKIMNIAISVIFVLTLGILSCNKQQSNQSPQPCISGPWYDGSGGYGDYLESDLNIPLSISASCSSDADSDTLTARWDWTGDGNWDTHFVSIYTTVNHQYPDTGWYELVLSVDDGKIAKLKSTMVHIK